MWVILWISSISLSTFFGNPNMHFKANFPANRLRRLRSKSFIRDLVQEVAVSVNDLICPLFITEGSSVAQPILSMPEIHRFSIDNAIKECQHLSQLGVKAVALFPNIPKRHKTECAKYCYSEDGLMQLAIREIKTALPDMGVIADIALDPYTLSGQDGIIDASGYVVNDVTVDILVKQALSLAKAGADMLAPSDMMDGRIGAIRQALEASGFTNTILLAYSAKFASNYYGPFRDAIDTKNNLAKADKFSYQLPLANINEALNEVQLDLQEGADIVMVKPGLPYLDVIAKIKQHFAVPTFAYQVSGEYAMLKSLAAADTNLEQAMVLESLISFKRAGADAVFSYFSKNIAKWLN